MSSGREREEITRDRKEKKETRSKVKKKRKGNKGIRDVWKRSVNNLVIAVWSRAVKILSHQPVSGVGRRAGYQGRASRLRQVSAVYTQSWLLPACARAPAKTVGAPRGAAYTLV